MRDDDGGWPKVYRNGRLVSKSVAAPRHGNVAPHIISDALPELRHPVTGKIMDSKSAFRAVTREAGCTEVGNEVQRGRTAMIDTSDPSRDIARAFRELGI